MKPISQGTADVIRHFLNLFLMGGMAIWAPWPWFWFTFATICYVEAWGFATKFYTKK